MVKYTDDLENYPLSELIEETNRLLAINANCQDSTVRTYTRHLIDTRLKPAIKAKRK